MAPTYPTGALVAVSPVVADDVAVDDVLMFLPPGPFPELDPWTIDGQAGGLSRLQGSSVVAGRVVRLVRSTASGPAVLVWPGVLLLLVASRLPRRTYRPRQAHA